MSAERHAGQSRRVRSQQHQASARPLARSIDPSLWIRSQTTAAAYCGVSGARAIYLHHQAS